MSGGEGGRNLGVATLILTIGAAGVGIYLVGGESVYRGGGRLAEGFNFSEVDSITCIKGENGLDL